MTSAAWSFAAAALAFTAWRQPIHGPTLAACGKDRGCRPRWIARWYAAILSRAFDSVVLVSGASDMTLQEVNEAAEAIYEMSHPDANIIFGAQIEEDMASVLSITVVATGFKE